MDPPEFLYREYDSKGTLRCDLMIFIARSTRYPDVDPWFISTTGFHFPDTYRKAARKTLRRLRMIYKHHLQQTPMGFFPPTEGRGRTWIARMRGLGREEEDLEDTVSHLSIYLTGLDELYREQAAPAILMWTLGSSPPLDSVSRIPIGKPPVKPCDGSE